MSTVAMLYHGSSEELHPAHRGFAEAIDADLVSISETSPHSITSFYQELTRAYAIGEYETVIAEGSRPLYTGVAHKTIHGSKLVYLCADHRLYDLWNNSVEVHSAYSLFKHLLGTHGKPVVRTVSQHGIDGIIAISEFVKEYLQPIFEDNVPTRVANPYIQPGLYEQLSQAEPELNSNVALTVGRPTRYKGVDLLAKAWPSVRKQYSNAELRIVGKGHPGSYEEYPGVTVLGFVDDIAEEYANAAVYVQPSRIEPFGVAVLEGMCAGLPAVITEMTGARVEITELDENLIAPTTPEGLSEAITWYFDRPLSEKKELAQAAKKRGNQFNAERCKETFRRQYLDLISDL